MSTRKIWNGTQWVQIGASIDDIEIVTSSAGAVDPSKLYFIASDATPGDLVTFRVNGKLGSGIWFGGNELWAPTQQATGGTETIIDVAGTPYKVHTFTASGDFEVLIPSLGVEYLVVGAGGDGGTANSAGLYYSGGGGGAGGTVKTGTTTLSAGILSCTLGIGVDTSFNSIVATKGISGSVGANPKAGNGGSNADYSGGVGPSSASNVTGGGGGAGAVANGSNGSVSGSSSSGTGGAGGAGVISSISGTSTTYGSGGGGGHGYGGFGWSTAGGVNAGSGASVNNATNPVPNRGGGGGGGAGYSAPKNPSSGAAGIVIVRYPLA